MYLCHHLFCFEEARGLNCHPHSKAMVLCHSTHHSLCILFSSATCDDGFQNQGETAVDCGGPCHGCSMSLCDEHPAFRLQRFLSSPSGSTRSSCRARSPTQYVGYIRTAHTNDTPLGHRNIVCLRHLRFGGVTGNSQAQQYDPFSKLSASAKTTDGSSSFMFPSGHVQSSVHDLGQPLH